MTDLKEHLNKMTNTHVPLKHLIFYIILLLIVLFFFKEQKLFETLLMMLVPFLIGTSVKVSLITLGILV
jgi:hypothetical protein